MLKAQTRLCLHLFHRAEALLHGLDYCSLLIVAAACPPLGPVRVAEASRPQPGPSSPCAVAGSTPTLQWQPWQHRGGAAAQPAPLASQRPSDTARKFSSISFVIHLPTAAAGAPLLSLCWPNAAASVPPAHRTLPGSFSCPSQTRGPK